MDDRHESLRTAEADFASAVRRLDGAVDALDDLLPFGYPARPTPISVGRLLNAARACGVWREQVASHVGPTWRPSQTWAYAPIWREAVTEHTPAIAAAIAALFPPAAVTAAAIAVAAAAQNLKIRSGALFEARRSAAQAAEWDRAFSAACAAGADYQAAHDAACEAAYVQLPHPPHPFEADEGARSALLRAQDALMRVFAWAAAPRAPWPSMALDAYWRGGRK